MRLAMWDLLGEVFTVESLMSPRNRLLTLHDGIDDLTHIRNEAIKRRFDIVPVEENDQITSVMVIDTGTTRPLSDHWLISRDTSIPDLLTCFVVSKRPALLVLYKQDVIGLVTPADLNKLPSRAFFYHLIGELEIKSAKLIRQFGMGEVEDVMSVIGNKKRKASIQKLVEGNADIDIIELLYLKELFMLIQKNEYIRSKLDFSTMEEARKSFIQINDLRNQTMHLVRPLLEKIPNDLNKLHDRVRISEALIVKFDEFIV